MEFKSNYLRLFDIYTINKISYENNYFNNSTRQLIGSLQ